MIQEKLQTKRIPEEIDMREQVMIMLAEGFEEVEAITITDLLRRAEIPAKTVSVTGDRLVKGAHGIPVGADLLFDEVDFDLVRMILLPGGMPGTTNLLAYDPLTKILKRFAEEERPLGAICAAPMVLAAHGILSGKNATIYEGMESELMDAVPTEGEVVRDGNLFTSKGPGTAMEFALQLIGFLCGEEKREEVKAGLLYRR